MFEVLLKEILGRYTRSIEEIEKKATRGEVVGDLIRRQVRSCLNEMQAVGAQPDDIRAAFDDLEHPSSEVFTSMEPRVSRLLTAMKLHVDFLLFIEEQQNLNSSWIKKNGEGFGFH